MNKRIGANLFLLLLGRLVAALISVISLRVMTSLLDPGEYGQWALLVAFQTFGMLFLINPVDQHVFRNTHAWWDEGVLLQHFGKYNIYILLVSLFVSAVVMCWLIWGQQADLLTPAMTTATGLIVGVVVYFGTWNIALSYLLNMLGFRAQSVTWMVASGLVGLLSSALLVWLHPHAISWIFGQAVGAMVGALGALRALSNHAIQNVGAVRRITFSDFLNRSTIVVFCLPLAAATGLMWMQNSGYRLFVGSFWGTAELAMLVVGLGISAQLTAIIESLAMQFLYPYFSRRISDAETEAQTAGALADLMNVLAPLYAIWAGFNAVCAAALLEILTDARYHAAVPFVIFGAMIEFMRCTTNLWSNTSRAVRRTQGLIAPYALGALVVWSGALAAAQFGQGLLVLSTLLVLAGVATCVAMIVLMQRTLRISIDKPRFMVGMGVMVAAFALAVAMPVRFTGMIPNLSLLLFCGVVSGFLMIALLWRNPALSRLLSTSLI